MDNIVVGDVVMVCFYHNANEKTGQPVFLSSNAEVLHVPVATGDGWRFRDLDTQALYYVSEGCTVIKDQRLE